LVKNAVMANASETKPAMPTTVNNVIINPKAFTPPSAKAAPAKSKKTIVADENVFTSTNISRAGNQPP